jgi:hypothetical protein
LGIEAIAQLEPVCGRACEDLIEEGERRAVADVLATAGSAARVVPDVPDVPDVARAQTAQASIAGPSAPAVQTDGPDAKLRVPSNGAAAGWCCSIGLGHVPAIRADGSIHCATCHPPYQQLTLA